jgi:hypothetical protein
VGRETVSGPEGVRPRRRWVVVELLVLIALVAVAVWNPFRSEHTFRVESATDVGALAQTEDWLRDGGQSALVGSRIVWVFGDTLFPQVASDGEHLRSSSSAWSDPSDPLVLHDPVDADGLPVQLIPFDALETAYNDLSGKPDDRIAVWPTSLLARPDGSAAVFFREVHVTPGRLHLSVVGSGIATLPPGGEVVVRDPAPLFHEPDPVFSSGAVEAGGFVYLYGCDRIEGVRFGCRVARAPSAGIHDRSAYTFWDGSRWSGDVADAAFSLEGPSGAPSVSWNRWLGSYLAVYALGLTSRVMMRMAPRPEGPWSDPVEAFVGLPTQPNTANYAALEHPELSTDGGRTVAITYFHPVGQFRGEFRLVRVRLA